MLESRNQRTGCPSDVSDEEWAFRASYLTLMKADAPQRKWPLRAIFNALRCMIRAGCPWRLIPQRSGPVADRPSATQRWIDAGCFENMVHELREMLRELAGRNAQHAAAVMDGLTVQSNPESGARAGCDGYKRRKGSKVPIAVDTLGHLLALKITPANEQERAQVADLARDVQEATGENVSIAYVDQGYAGQDAAQQAARRLESWW